MNMDKPTIENYVRSTLKLNAYALDEEQVQRVITQFERIENISLAMRELQLPFSLDPAPVFRP